MGVNEKFDIKAELHVAAEHRGSIRDIYVVAIYKGIRYMKDSNNNWQVWDGNINSLVSNATQTLADINPLTIVQGLSGLPGNIAIFVGHSSSGGDIHYNSAPLNILVQ